MATEAELRQQTLAKTIQDTGRAKSLLEQARKKAAAPPTKSQLLKQTRQVSVQRTATQKKKLGQIAAERKKVLELEKQTEKFLKTDAGKLQYAKEQGITPKKITGRAVKGGVIQVLGFEYNTPFGKVIDWTPREKTKVTQAKVERIESAERASLGSALGLTSPEKLKQAGINIRDLVAGKEITIKGDVGNLKEGQVIRLEGSNLIASTPEKSKFEQLISGEPITLEDIIAQGGSIGDASLPEKTFGQRVKKFGVVTATTEALGDIFAKDAKRRQDTKTLKSIIRDKIGVDIPEPTILKLKKEFDRKTGLSPEQKRIADVEIARLIGSTAPFIIPVAGGILATTAGVESVTTPGGKKRIEDTKEFLKDKNIPEQLAYIPSALLTVGGGVQIASEIKAFNALSKLSKIDDIIKTDVASPNVKRSETTKILQNLDDQTQAVIRNNKLSAGRVYETTIGTGKDAKIIKFLEFGKGKSGLGGFEGSRYLYGVEVDKTGKIISRIGGVSIEKTTESGVSRSITNLIRTTTKRGRITVTPKQKKQILTFIEEQAGKGIGIQDFTLRGSRGEVRLVRDTGQLSKILPEDFAFKPGDAEKIRRFLAGDKVKVGNKIADITTSSIELTTKGELRVISKRIGDNLGGVNIRKITKGVEGGRIFTKTPEFKVPKTSTFRKISDKADDVLLKTKLKDPYVKPSITKDPIKGIKPFTSQELAPRIVGGEGKLASRFTGTGIDVVQLSAPTLAPSGVPGAFARTILKSDITGKIIPGFLGKSLIVPSIITKESIESNIKSVQKIGLQEKIKLNIKEDSEIQSKIEQNLKQQLSTKQPIRTAVQVKQPLQIKQVFKTKQVSRGKTKSSEKPIKPITPKLPSITDSNKKVRSAFAEKKKTDGFIPEIKDRGKYKRFTKPFKTKEQAEKFGRWGSDNSTSARYRIKSVTKVKEFSKKMVPYTSPLKFRNYKIQKGKRIPLEDFGAIEKRTNRIDTKGEKEGLRIAKLVKNRFGKKKSRISIISSIKSPPKIKIKS